MVVRRGRLDFLSGLYQRPMHIHTSLNGLSEYIKKKAHEAER